MVWKIALLLSLEISLAFSAVPSSLKCFVCDDCPEIGLNELNYLEVCTNPELPPEPLTSSTPVVADIATTEVEKPATLVVEPTTTTTTMAVEITTTTAADELSSNEEEISTTVKPQSFEETTSEPITTTSQPELNELNESNEETEISITTESIASTTEEDVFVWEDRRTTVQQRRKRDIPAKHPFCYVLRYKDVEKNQMVTKRGCGLNAEKDSSDEKICTVLSNEKEDAQCSLCQTDKCNGASGLTSTFGFVGFVLVLVQFLGN